MSDDNKAPTFGTLAPLSWDVRVDADKHGEPRPKPPTLELVVEVVVDRWEP